MSTPATFGSLAISAKRPLTRAIWHQTRGSTHGPITRLISPAGLGEWLKPFVFLDFFSAKGAPGRQGFGMHPHSGIATLTFMIRGEVRYEDTTGKQGVLSAGGVEWLRAGNGVWHSADPLGDLDLEGFQLWVALPASEENAPAQSIYLEPSEVAQDGPARVLLGHYGAAQSAIPAPSDMTYLAVRLKDGEHWRYTPPQGHTVVWVAVNEGELQAGEAVHAGELAVFDDSDKLIDFEGRGETSFVLGSAVKHPHDLVTGHYSVHTSRQALAQGEAGIQRIGATLQRAGR